MPHFSVFTRSTKKFALNTLLILTAGLLYLQMMESGTTSVQHGRTQLDPGGCNNGIIANSGNGLKTGRCPSVTSIVCYFTHLHRVSNMIVTASLHVRQATLTLKLNGQGVLPLQFCAIQTKNKNTYFTTRREITHCFLIILVHVI